MVVGMGRTIGARGARRIALRKEAMVVVVEEAPSPLGVGVEWSGDVVVIKSNVFESSFTMPEVRCAARWVSPAAELVASLAR